MFTWPALRKDTTLLIGLTLVYASIITNGSPAFGKVQPKPLLNGHFITLTISEPAGITRTAEIVTSGVPFPIGALTSIDELRLKDEKGLDTPLQCKATGVWPDKSIQWALLSFPCSVGGGLTRKYALEYGKGVRQKAFPKLDSAAKNSFLNQPPTRSMRIEIDGKTLEQSVVAGAERTGPVRNVDIISGPMIQKERFDKADWVSPTFASIFALSARTLGAVGSSSQSTAYTLKQVSDKPVLALSKWEITAIDHLEGKQLALGIDGKSMTFPIAAGDKYELAQTQDSRCVLTNKGKIVASGRFADGWVTVRAAGSSQTITVKNFRKQHPMAFVVQPDKVQVRLWAGSSPFAFTRGLAKTIEIMTTDGGLNDHGIFAAISLNSPLFAVAPASWYCASKALGDLMAFDVNRLAMYETRVGQLFDKAMAARKSGFVDAGDIYLNGSTSVGDETDLESDVSNSLLIQFARTGLRKYLIAGIAAASHRIDFDVNHATGQTWKHQWKHTETPADLGLTFVDGAIAYYHLTGDPRGLETVREIGNWAAKALRKRSETASELQVGRGLRVVVSVYLATGDEKLFEAAKDFTEKLVSAQDSVGKFELKIDKPSAHFAGELMSGLISVYDLTKAPRLAAAITKLAERSLAYEPDVAGRTIPGYIWCYLQTKDAKFLDAIKGTWSLVVAASQKPVPGPIVLLHCTGILRFVALNGLLPVRKLTTNMSPARFASIKGPFCTHLESSAGSVTLNDPDGSKYDVTVLRHGNSGAGSLQLTLGAQAAERLVTGRKATSIALRLPFAPSMEAVESRTFNNAGMGIPGKLKVSMAGIGTVAWDIITSRAIERIQ